MTDLPASPDKQVDTQERSLTPLEAIEGSNREVIVAIYGAAGEVVPDALVQETNGSKAYVHSAELIRLVYDGEREEAQSNPQGLPVNPAVDKLSELVANGTVSHTKVPDVHEKGFRPAGDRLYEAIDKAWGPVYAFTDVASDRVLCYSVRTDTHSEAETVLVSPEHIDTHQAA